MVNHRVCERDKESLVKMIIWMRTDVYMSSPHASGRSFRTVVVLSSAKNAPRWIHLKWLM